jgi:hypothetical protein
MYEQGVALCVTLALTELEMNCIAAMFDPHCLGDCASAVRTDESVPASTPIPCQIPAYVRYLTPFVANASANHIRELMESLNVICEPPPNWTRYVRVKRVSTSALSKAWRMPQNHIRICIRDLKRAGMVEENAGEDSIYLTPYLTNLRYKILEETFSH